MDAASRLLSPGWYTGYDAKTPPRPREAIEERRYSDADEQIALVAHAIEDEAAYVEHIATELDSAVSSTESPSATSTSR